MTLTLWENFYDYTLKIDNKQYSLSTPFSGIYIYGKLYIDNNYKFINNSNFEIHGQLEIQGNFGSELVIYDVIITINSDGNGGRVTGTINDIQVDYEF